MPTTDAPSSPMPERDLALVMAVSMLGIVLLRFAFRGAV